MSRELSLGLLDYGVRIGGLALAAFIVYSAWCRVREGKFERYGIEVDKDNNPGSFWAVLALGLIGAACLVYVSVS